jgi:hypothetical protein
MSTQVRYGWTLSKIDWEKVPNDLNSGHWRNVGFHINNAQAVPAVPGVYAFCSPPPFSDGPSNFFRLLNGVLYIGQSKDMRRRFLEHANQPKKLIMDARKCYAEHLTFWWIRVNEDDLDRAESSLITCLGPPANELGGRLVGRVGNPIRAASMNSSATSRLRGGQSQ